MSTLKTNNIQHVDRSDPSIIINTDGSVNIAGTMTYEDVTNVDAVGIITGRNNIDAQKQVLVGTGVSIAAGGLNVTAGITTVQALQATTISGTTGTFTSDVSIADKIVHTGDTDTAVRFPAADTFTVETGGSERFRINSSGQMGLGTNNPVQQSGIGLHINNGGGQSRIKLTNNNSGSTANDGFDIIQEADSEIHILNHENASIKFGTNDAEKARIDSSGRLLIGLTASQTTDSNAHSKLQVATSAGPNIGLGNNSTDINDDGRLGVINFNSNHGGTYHEVVTIRSAADADHASNSKPSRLEIYTTSSGNTQATERLRITSDGVIGINDTNPGSGKKVKIVVSDNSSYQMVANLTNNVNADLNFYIKTNESLIAPGTSTPLCLGSGQAEKLRIDSSGRLLIGTTSHTGHALSSSNNSKVQLESASSADYGRMSLIYNGNDGVGPGFWFGKSRGTSIGSNTVVVNGDQLGGLFFHAADGTDKHSRAASIVVAVDGAPGANDTPGRISFNTCIDGQASTTEKVRIPASTWGLLVTNLSSTGSTGGYQTEGVSLRYSGDSTFVKTDGPPVTLTRKGNAGKVIDFYNASTYAGGIYVNGSGNTAIQQTSDYRLKTDVSSMTDGIVKVKLLNPIYFKNNTGFDTTTTQNGFLAHEIQTVLPTLVDGEKDGDIDERGKGYQTMDYAGLTPTLTAAVKELIAKVETLETKVAALEGS